MDPATVAAVLVAVPVAIRAISKLIERAAAKSETSIKIELPSGETVEISPEEIRRMSADQISELAERKRERDHGKATG